MDFSSQGPRLGFWKRHTTKHPGQVKPVPGKMGASGMVFGAQYSHMTAMQMDNHSWAMKKSSLEDDEDDDRNPALAGYSTLPAQDIPDDTQHEKDASNGTRWRDGAFSPKTTDGFASRTSSLGAGAASANSPPSSRSLPSTVTATTATTTSTGPSDTSSTSPSSSAASTTAKAGGSSSNASPNLKMASSSALSPSNSIASPTSPTDAGSIASRLSNTHIKDTSTDDVSKRVQGMKSTAHKILHDPLVILKGLEFESAMGDLHLVGTEHPADEASHVLQNNKQKARFQKFKTALQMPVVDLDELRKLSWSGVPAALRPMVWQLLVGYLPSNADRRSVALERKRKEYQDGVQKTFAKGIEGLDQTIWHQVFIDVPRTNPKLALFQNPTTQRCLERILYCWAIRHPASSYVQGINDLVTPFFLVFLTAYIDEDQDPECYDISQLPEEILAGIEADSFWCLSKLLDGIQDNYTHAQPGIQRQIAKLRDLICRIDAPLAAHLQSEHVEFIQFSFRWMNCLLMREVSLQHTIRMWDTYLTEHPHGFSEFHLYVCAAFLTKWSAELQHLEFQDIMLFLQAVPTDHWQESDIELLLSEAFMWKTLFHASPMHLGGAK
ncbi:GTPase-activating protein [Actinomortierella ambigua]|nr:GTPase-activating protein [Actinomortierella ambigua]